VRGATTGCRRASEGSCAARADAGVDGSSVAGTGGEGDKGSSPGSDEETTATSVAGGEMRSRDAETQECVAGFHNDEVGGNQQVEMVTAHLIHKTYALGDVLKFLRGTHKALRRPPNVPRKQL